MSIYTTLVEQDQAHLLHPLHHPSAHENALIFESGHGVWMRTVDGKEVIDGLAGLWNVLIGHGRAELADAAREQMATLAYCSSYAGSANIPAIRLADRLAGFAYTARFEWMLRAIERDRYCLRSEYPERKGLQAAMWMAWSALAGIFSLPLARITPRKLTPQPIRIEKR